MYLVYDYVVGREVEEMDSRFSVLGFGRSLIGRSVLIDPGEGFLLLLLCNGGLMDREIGSFKITSFVIIGLLVGLMPCIPPRERLVLPE